MLKFVVSKSTRKEPAPVATQKVNYIEDIPSSAASMTSSNTLGAGPVFTEMLRTCPLSTKQKIATLIRNRAAQKCNRKRSAIQTEGSKEDRVKTQDRKNDESGMKPSTVNITRVPAIHDFPTTDNLTNMLASMEKILEKLKATMKQMSAENTATSTPPRKFITPSDDTRIQERKHVTRVDTMTPSRDVTKLPKLMTSPVVYKVRRSYSYRASSTRDFMLQTIENDRREFVFC